MSFTKLFQRTSMPFDNGGQYSSISPSTDKSRVVPLFGDTPSLNDIINGTVTKNVDVHGRGSWGLGEDDWKSFKETGNEYMIDQKIEEILQRMNGKGKQNKPKWVILTNDGKEIAFDDYNQAQREIAKNHIPYRILMKRTAQNNQSFKEYIDKAINSTFKSVSINKNIRETGAAFAIDNNIFLTCAHCVKKYNKLSMPNKNTLSKETNISLEKNGQIFPAELIDIDPNIDAAIIKCNVESEFLTLGFSNKTDIGTRVFTVGSPKGFEENVTEGILSSRNRVVFNYPNAPKFLFTDAHVFPGSSGGALISCDNGAVIGMMALIVAGDSLYGLNAAVPSEELSNFIKKSSI